jgi:acyl carrier protein
MTVHTTYQPEAIADSLRTHIREEIAYDRSGLTLTNAFPLVEQGVIDSMGILRVVTFIEEKFGIALEPADLMLENFETIDAITAFILRKLTPA